MSNTKPYTNYVLLAIEAIKAQVDNDPFRHKTSTELLDQLCTPNRNLTEKAFKDVYGCRIKEYQLKKRLNISKKYLAEGMPKKILAKKCFYGSVSAFSNAFKKEFGIAPTFWENNFRYEITDSNVAKT